MKISEVCTRTGLTDKAIRFYIEKGLLKKQQKTLTAEIAEITKKKMCSS